jgi:hypothetical protein
MIAVPVGKAKLRIHIEGCRDCGTLWAPAWHIVETVAVTTWRFNQLSRSTKVDVPVCRDCFKKLKRRR